MFQIITASFRAVALTATVRPFLKAIRLKKSDKCVSFKLPIALAEFRKAIFSRLLPLAGRRVTGKHVRLPLFLEIRNFNVIQWNVYQ